MADLDAARAAHAHDIARLEHLTDEQVDYLAHVDEVEDPITDGKAFDDEDV